ncbi:MAG: alpha/beta hydrolase [Anaerolineae bacterium]
MSFPSSSPSKESYTEGNKAHTSGEHQSIAQPTQSSLSRRRTVRWLVRAAAVVVALILSGIIYESVSEAADARAYPPPGQMVDIGGYRMHINCTGTGSPTVVIDAGLGAWSLEWSEVQAEAAKTTRVCTYDRAGMGYSEAGPLPRNAEQFASELHTLLERASVEGPYLLVGHSLGGLSVRVFVQRYPTEVAGVVLIDSMSPRQMTQPPSQTEAQTPAPSGGSALPAVLARMGLVRVLAGQLITQGLPREVQPAHNAFSVTPRSVQAFADEGAALQESLAQADAVTSFGDLPLVVLTTGQNHIANWQAMQAELLALSSSSQQIIVENSGHNIQIDNPAAAVAAIVNLVMQLR